MFVQCKLIKGSFHEDKPSTYAKIDFMDEDPLLETSLYDPEWRREVKRDVS